MTNPFFNSEFRVALYKTGNTGFRSTFSLAVLYFSFSANLRGRSPGHVSACVSAIVDFECSCFFSSWSCLAFPPFLGRFCAPSSSSSGRTFPKLLVNLLVSCMSWNTAGVALVHAISVLSGFTPLVCSLSVVCSASVRVVVYCFVYAAHVGVGGPSLFSTGPCLTQRVRFVAALVVMYVCV